MPRHAHNFVDLTGRRIKDWKVLRFVGRETGHTVYKCKCVCGTIKNVLKGNLVKSQGCGCKNLGLRLRPYEALYRLFLREQKRGYRKGKVTVKLTYEEFVSFTSILVCHYCSVPIVWTKFWSTGPGSWTAYHLDRKRPSGDYTKNNCVVCCSRCNRAKSNLFTYKEFLEIGKVIRRWSSGTKARR